MRYCVVCGEALKGEGSRNLLACSKCRIRYEGLEIAGVDRPELSLFQQLQQRLAGLGCWPLDPLFPPNKL